VPLPSASVIVRAHDSRADLEQLLPALRRQTVAAELVVVDSGSRDGSQAVAERRADLVLELARGTYSPGRSLNRGAAQAGGEILLPFSSHCRPPSDDWIERCLSHYSRPDVVATNGASRDAGKRPLSGVFHQDGGHARAHPNWGYSNHASSLRAEAWRDHPFDEEVRTAEDRLWAIEVTARGWVIAHDPALCVSQEHRYKQGTVNFLRRERRELIVIGANVAMPAYSFNSLLRDWWSDVPSNDRYPRPVHRFLNFRRTAGMLGRYLGHREARRIRR
jgi:glycosyltransferase involved in cell wall biosynthesis